MLNQQGKWFTNRDTFHDYASAQSDAVVYTPGAGKAIRILGYTISTDGANDVTVKVGSTTVLKFYFGANGGANIDSDQIPVAVGIADEQIKVSSTSATGHSVAFTGFEQ